VIAAGWSKGWGKSVKIDHGDGLVTLYAHLSRIYVKRGNEVKMGSTIGGVGNTGRSTSTHLHYTVYKDKKPVDPLSFTYERLWSPPHDARNKFNDESKAKYALLLQSLENKESFFVDEMLAEESSLKKQASIKPKEIMN